MGRIKDKEKTLKLVKDNGESSNTLGDYTGVGTVTFYLNKKLKIKEKYYGNIFHGKKHGYGEYKYQNGDFYQGLYEHGKKNGIGTYFYNMEDKQGKDKGRGARGAKDESSEEEEKSDDDKGKNENSDEERGIDEEGDEENKESGKDGDSEKDTSEEEGENDQSGSNQSGDDESGNEEGDEDEGDEDEGGEDEGGDEQSGDEQSDQNEQDKGKGANNDGYQNNKKGHKAADNEKDASKRLLNLMQKWNNTKMKKETIIPPKDKGSFYYGNYANGLKHNEGMMLYRNGDVYVGGWKFGKKSGWGRYTYKKCKSILEGHWEDGYLKHGKWILPNGMYFVGNFKNNKPSGDGVWAFADRTQLNVFYYEVKQVK